MKIKTSVIIAIVLSVLLLAAVGYIGYGAYVRTQYSKLTDAYNVGYEQAYVDVMNGVSTCQAPIPLTYGNTTLNIVAVECLQQTGQ